MATGNIKLSALAGGSIALQVDDTSTTGEVVTITKAQWDKLDQIIGVDQTWQDMTSQRVAGVDYTNTTGKPIFVKINGVSSNTNAYYSITVDGLLLETDRGGQSTYQSVSVLVPSGSTYIVNSSAEIFTWFELRGA